MRYQPGTPHVYVNPPLSQLQSESCSGSVSIAYAFPSPSLSAQFSEYSKTYTCDVRPPSSTALTPPPYAASLGGALSPGAVLHSPPPLMSKAELHSTACSTFAPPWSYEDACSVSSSPLESSCSYEDACLVCSSPLESSSSYEDAFSVCSSPLESSCSYADACSVCSSPLESSCSYEDACSPLEPLWWPSEETDTSQCSVNDNPPAVVQTVSPGSSPWSAPPVPVAGQPAFTYPAGTSCLRPLSPMSPSLSAPPLHREPVGQLRHLDRVAMSSCALATRNAHPLDLVLQQRRLRHVRVACTCPNCASGANSKATNPDGSPRKKQHVCHYPNCSKAYGYVSHLRAHIRWHTGERPFICHWLYCGKRFTTSVELQRHLRTHTGEKRFVCAECGKRFMRSDVLNKHIKTHQKLREKEAVSSNSDNLLPLEPDRPLHFRC